MSTPSALGSDGERADAVNTADAQAQRGLKPPAIDSNGVGRHEPEMSLHGGSVETASNKPPQPLTALKCGSPKGREQKYTIDSGVFVLAANYDIEYDIRYTIEGTIKTATWKDRFAYRDASNNPKKIEYKGLWKNLRKTFNLDSKCVLETALESDDSDDKFSTFTWQLKKKVDKFQKGFKKDPSFLMLVLVSAGLQYGEFILSGKKKCSDACKWDPKKKSFVHKRSGPCNIRRVSDFVREIQQTGLFANKPKIFLIQTVSGETAAFEKGDGELKPAKIDYDDYIPRASDTFVLYAHTTTSVRWINENGFYLITKFCAAVNNLTTHQQDNEPPHNVVACNEMLKKLTTLWNLTDDAEEKTRKDPQGELDVKALKRINDHIDEKLGIKLVLEAESLIDAWFDNLCATVTAEVANCKDYDSGMRAHTSSTLRYKLSVRDLIQAE